MPDTISMGLSADYASPLEGVGEALSGVFRYHSLLNLWVIRYHLTYSRSYYGVVHHTWDLTLELRFLTDSYKGMWIEPIRKLTSFIPTIESFSATNGPVQLGFMKSGLRLLMQAILQILQDMWQGLQPMQRATYLMQ